MTERDDTTGSTSERSLRERWTHSARIARLAVLRRDREPDIDRDAARRLTVARLHAGVML